WLDGAAPGNKTGRDWRAVLSLLFRSPNSGRFTRPARLSCQRIALCLRRQRQTHAQLAGNDSIASGDRLVRSDDGLLVEFRAHRQARRRRPARLAPFRAEPILYGL